MTAVTNKWKNRRWEGGGGGRGGFVPDPEVVGGRGKEEGGRERVEEMEWGGGCKGLQYKLPVSPGSGNFSSVCISLWYSQQGHRVILESRCSEQARSIWCQGWWASLTPVHLMPTHSLSGPAPLHGANAAYNPGSALLNPAEEVPPSSPPALADITSPATENMAAASLSDSASSLPRNVVIKTEPETEGGLLFGSEGVPVKRDPVVSLVAPVSGLQPLAWSQDHRLAVCTTSSLSLMELVCDVHNNKQDLALHRTSIPVPTEAYKLRVGPATEQAQMTRAFSTHQTHHKASFLADK
ncbi:general transcription factor 3C polypeptide 4 [Lates japonicus]|uniref:General transcription factor 3C polypeptide 4 n=1 Tax=Lates japonicus TaxID=270547 RepID=A0AAD3N764_LATJO|nr:general transcription factor 3C polypeptide 4 [Lates japonicus]